MKLMAPTPAIQAARLPRSRQTVKPSGSFSSPVRAGAVSRSGRMLAAQVTPAGKINGSTRKQEDEER